MSEKRLKTNSNNSAAKRQLIGLPFDCRAVVFRILRENLGSLAFRDWWMDHQPDWSLLLADARYAISS